MILNSVVNVEDSQCECLIDRAAMDVSLADIATLVRPINTAHRCKQAKTLRTLMRSSISSYTLRKIYSYLHSCLLGVWSTGLGIR